MTTTRPTYTAPSAELRERVLAAARTTPSAPREATRARFRRVLGGGFALLVASLALFRPQVGSRPSSLLLTGLVVCLAVLGVGLGLGVSRGRSMLGRPSAVLAAVALAAAPLLAAWGVTTTLLWPEASTGSSLRQDVVCAVLIGLLALPPLLALMYTRRGSDPVHPRASGAALGAAAGAAACLVNHVHCPLVDGVHLGVAHALPVLLLAAAGAVAGEVWLSVRGIRP